MNSPVSAKPRWPGASPTLGQMQGCDPHRLARGEERWQGAIEATSLKRFASVLIGTGYTVQWQAIFSEDRLEGGSRGPWMSLSYCASVQLACGRCAEPLELVIDESRRFTFAPNEAEASRLDEQAFDHDVLVADPRFDLVELIEDELILAVPVMALHERCPATDPGGNAGADSGAVLASGGEPETQRPFANLASQLRAASKGKADSGGASDSQSVAGPKGSGSTPDKSGSGAGGQ